MKALQVGQVVRDRLWGGKYLGTVVRIEEGSVFVQWHDTCVEDQRQPDELEPTDLPNPEGNGLKIAATVMGTKTVEQYADEIMTMIREDMASNPAMQEARSFGDLHDYVDANEYMIQADVPFDPDDQAVMNFYIDVQDAVSRRLVDQA